MVGVEGVKVEGVKVEGVICDSLLVGVKEGVNEGA